MARKIKGEFVLVKADKNLVDAEWRYFTLTQRKLFWYIAKRMQELGFTRDSLYIQDVLTPIKTKVLMLDTGEVKESETSKDLSFKHRIRKPIQRNKHNTRSSARSSKKYQKTTLTFKDKERKKETYCSVIPKADFSDDGKSIEIHMYAEMAYLLLELQQYITMNLNKILDFKSQYTLRMYELLNKVKKQDYPEFKLTLEQANKMFDTKYERLVDIERYIIKVAQKRTRGKSRYYF